jgi:hypothetical protein
MTPGAAGPTLEDMHPSVVAATGARHVTAPPGPGATPAAVASPDLGVVDLASVLVLLQGAIALLSAFEVTFFGLALATPALLPSIGATGGLALVTLALASGLRRRSRLARRITVTIEVLVLLAALVDLGLALALAHAFLDPVPAITRLLLPAAVVVLLRRPAARAAFRVRPSRRERRES